MYYDLGTNGDPAGVLKKESITSAAGIELQQWPAYLKNMACFPQAIALPLSEIEKRLDRLGYVRHCVAHRHINSVQLTVLIISDAVFVFRGFKSQSFYRRWPILTELEATEQSVSAEVKEIDIQIQQIDNEMQQVRFITEHLICQNTVDGRSFAEWWKLIVNATNNT